ncbi:MAG: HNH endonuclease [Oceanospirillaceae bacterium]|nr:HNH endonuclease [Oceanospirillaceae bacterium]|tara:strand:+ start:15433 stop:16197 length:765 start_codon:yes stop_codon:yes gene_type:complete
MSASYPTRVFLAFKSGGRCAFKDCQKVLTSDGVNSNPAIIGEAAHIYGESPGTKTKPASARYRTDMTDAQRNHYNNLIYLCPTCHTKIDKQEKDYPAELLFALKAEHESWVAEQLDLGMSEVSFAELEVAAKALASGKHSSNGDSFEVIPPEEKINKNGLSDTVRSDIAMGLSKSHEVERFLANMATNVDEDFPERLKSGFKEKYLELKTTLSGDELFASMLEFAQAGQKDFRQQAAGLAILSHLFHLCEVFEK